MNAIDFIRMSLEGGRKRAVDLIKDMADAPTTSPTPRGGNHPAWVAGHLACTEGAMVAVFILGKPNPAAKLEPLFGLGSAPVADPGKYPPIAELIAEGDRVRAQTLEVLAGLTEADLDKPSHAPPQFAPVFGTIGRCLSTLISHQMFHTGQVADARRAAGRKPLFA